MMQDKITSPETADDLQPICREHPGCFANMNGACMALKSPPLLPCPFFKTSEDHRRGQARAFYGLISQGRFDLIRKYIETYRDAGFLDGEIEQAEERRAELNMFAVENLMELRGYYAMNPFVESSQSQESDENEDDGDGLDDILENHSENTVDVDEGGIAEEHEPEEADEVFPEDMDEHGILELEGLSQNASDEATDENSIGDVDLYGCLTAYLLRC